MNHGEFGIERTPERRNNNSNKTGAKDKGIFNDEFGPIAERKVSGTIKSSDGHGDVYETKNKIGTKTELVIKKINNGPSIHIGNATIEKKGVFGVFKGRNDKTGTKVAGTLPDVFTRSSDEKIGNYKKENRESVENCGNEDVFFGSVGRKLERN